jgi:cytochrome oxidase Cu insertion factor (SCO1/SenC/PrrC family)
MPHLLDRTQKSSQQLQENGDVLIYDFLFYKCIDASNQTMAHLRYVMQRKLTPAHIV